MMGESADTLRVSAAEMQQCFKDILIRNGLAVPAATECARIFTESSLDGIYTHGVNRFPRFIHYIRAGYVNPTAVPTLEKAMQGWEQWNGNLGPGITNALHATNRAMDLARSYGIGCVALRNTNHWMRGGSYGWHAARVGFVLINWTNTIANMPAWGARDARLGNNPLVLSMPFKDEAVVLDMAMSQYSYGALEQASLRGTTLAVNGGFDQDGQLTSNPSAILESNRPLPVGYWKGAGLSLLLDLLSSVLSGGLATFEISKEKVEFGLSQVFIAINLSKSDNSDWISKTISSVLEDYKLSVPASQYDTILYPGERVLRSRKKNLEEGIPVLRVIWEEIQSL